MMPKRKNQITLASARTERAVVDHPRLSGYQEQVTRVVVVIDMMRRRKQLTEAQYQAAQTFAAAHDVIYGSIGRAMDPDKIRGSASPGSPPPPSYLMAAERLRQAKTHLYARDYRSVILIAGEGRSIEETAHLIMGGEGRPGKQACREIGRCFRTGLDELAGIWFPNLGAGHPKMAAWNDGTEVSAIGDAEIVPGRVIHATGRRIYHSGPKPARHTGC